MAKYQVEVTDEVVVEVDVPPGLPPLTRVQLEWSAGGASPAAMAAGRLGFELSSGRPEALSWRRVPLRRDGEEAGFATIALRGEGVARAG